MNSLLIEELEEINGGFDPYDFAIGTGKIIGGIIGCTLPEPATTIEGGFLIVSGLADIVDAFDYE
ncbi:class IIb bacteriocin, lactobin A/cerein 7B family [Defluviitalea phaphyphila]|uniref:class IIb bacteriocin, lactobin A/cerein 7B family n=1 Tax=Defluviitalea phaphyphila TaxID=1473580 RepID=UPI0007306478|nr:class IIb bacteriocin, lactobin A/cerein 7B family [Defluviitalea phaphyphila]